jgi:hypothetical protein
VKVIRDYPPNIEAIRQTFGAAAVQNAVFTYGDTVYIPNANITMPAHLETHEAVHIEQQGDDPAGWWDRYLDDPQFRLDQELEAYRAQYQYLIKHASRPSRRLVLARISKDLGGRLYGNIITPAEAKREITQ